MNDRVYIVLYESWRGTEDDKYWRFDGLYDTKAAAEDYIDQQRKAHPYLSYAWVEGPICEVESMREAEKRLGAF